MMKNPLRIIKYIKSASSFSAFGETSGKKPLIAYYVSGRYIIIVSFHATPGIPISAISRSLKQDIKHLDKYSKLLYIGENDIKLVPKLNIKYNKSI